MQGGFANARDVGGLPVTGGRQVRRGVLYRSDAPFHDDEAPSALAPWPPHTVVDLRSEDEVSDPHPLAHLAARVVTVPLSARAELGAIVNQIERLDLSTLYAVMMREKGPVVVRVAELIAEAPGPVLVHCTAGKDRTGVAIATVLAAVGVPRDDIVKDYVETETNMPGVLDRMKSASGPRSEIEARERVARIPTDLLGAPSIAIETVLDTLESHPRGAAGWLVDHGLSPADLQLLEDRLVL